MKNAESEQDRIISFFNPETLQKWAKEVEQCDGNHEGLHLMEKVRKITMNDEFITLNNSGTDYLIPDASEASVPGVEDAVPRGFIQDVILYAEIMAYSKFIKHNLSTADLETLYKHHCVEPMIAYGKVHRMTTQESLITLGRFIDRIVTKVHLLAGDGGGASDGSGLTGGT